MKKTEATKICVCRQCPTYFDCAEPLAYCLSTSAPSMCIIVERGCICPECPVQIRTSYQHVYYCLRGSEVKLIRKAKSRQNGR